MTYLESLKEDRQQCMEALKEISSLPKLKTGNAKFLRYHIKKEIKWLMGCVHHMNKKIKQEEKKNDRKEN
ncbi:hypothetical protein ABH963_000089 [Bacillus sp. RC55]|uniref:hypothetical protein n=1 Tax=Bacillus sp. RC55 TaxID=3156292 RepID=UPI00383518A2